MKTIKMNVMMTALAAFILTTGNTGFANKLEAPIKPEPFAKENRDIRQDLVRIGMHRDRIKFLEAKLKDDRAAGDKSAVIMDKKELRKTKADLKRDKCYLKADKKDLRSDRKLAIREKREAVRTDRKNLADAKRQLREDQRSDSQNESHSQKMVNTYKEDLDRDKIALQKEKSDYTNNMIVVNKSIRRSKGEFFVINYAEGGMANISKWMRK
jgi:hypothetical protein